MIQLLEQAVSYVLTREEVQSPQRATGIILPNEQKHPSGREGQLSSHLGESPDYRTGRRKPGRGIPFTKRMRSRSQSGNHKKGGAPAWGNVGERDWIGGGTDTSPGRARKGWIVGKKPCS